MCFFAPVWRKDKQFWFSFASNVRVCSKWLNNLRAGDVLFVQCVTIRIDLLNLIDRCYAFCFERHVGDKMENSMPTCFVLWMWQMCPRVPCLTNRALRKPFGCWKRWKYQPILSSWRLGITSHTSPSDTLRWRAAWGLIQHSHYYLCYLFTRKAFVYQRWS